MLTKDCANIYTKTHTQTLIELDGEREECQSKLIVERITKTLFYNLGTMYFKNKQKPVSRKRNQNNYEKVI